MSIAESSKSPQSPHVASYISSTPHTSARAKLQSMSAKFSTSFSQLNYWVIYFIEALLVSSLWIGAITILLIYGNKSLNVVPIGWTAECNAPIPAEFPFSNIPVTCREPWSDTAILTIIVIAMACIFIVAICISILIYIRITTRSAVSFGQRVCIMWILSFGYIVALNIIMSMTPSYVLENKVSSDAIRAYGLGLININSRVFWVITLGSVGVALLI